MNDNRYRVHCGENYQCINMLDTILTIDQQLREENYQSAYDQCVRLRNDIYYGFGQKWLPHWIHLIDLRIAYILTVDPTVQSQQIPSTNPNEYHQMIQQTDQLCSNGGQLLHPFSVISLMERQLQYTMDDMMNLLSVDYTT